MKKKIRLSNIKGITLVEVMIAVVVLSVATLGVMGALTFGIVSNDYAGTYSEANQVAREIVEGVRASQLAFEQDNQPDLYAAVFDANKKALGSYPFDGQEATVPGFPNLSTRANGADRRAF